MVERRPAQYGALRSCDSTKLRAARPVSMAGLESGGNVTSSVLTMQAAAVASERGLSTLLEVLAVAICAFCPSLLRSLRCDYRFSSCGDNALDLVVSHSISLFIWQATRGCSRCFASPRSSAACSSGQCRSPSGLRRRLLAEARDSTGAVRRAAKHFGLWRNVHR